MSQMSVSDAEHAGKRKRTRRETFLAKIDSGDPFVHVEERPHTQKHAQKPEVR